MLRRGREGPGEAPPSPTSGPSRAPPRYNRRTPVRRHPPAGRAGRSSSTGRLRRQTSPHGRTCGAGKGRGAASYPSWATVSTPITVWPSLRPSGGLPSCSFKARLPAAFRAFAGNQNALSPENLDHRPDDDLDIQQKAPILYVPYIQFTFLLERKSVSTTDLSEPRHAGLHVMPAGLAGGGSTEMFHQQRPRAA